MALEKRRKELELARVETARKELEFRILEREEEISKLKEHINIQLAKEADIKKEISNL